MNLRKIIITLFLTAVIISGVGCKQHDQKSKQGEYASIYIAVFDSYFDIDPGLHENMEYLAIDMDSLTNSTDEDKKAVGDYFANKFNIEIKDMSFKELKEQGFVNGMNNQIDGLLIYIDNLDITEDVIIIEGTKFKSGNGANGIESILKKNGKEWVLEGSRVTVMA